MNIFVTGGTGFVGGAIVQKLLNDGHKVKLLKRADSKNQSKEKVANSNIEYVDGDLLKPIVWKDALIGCDAVIHLVGIIREVPKRKATFNLIHKEGTKAVVNAAVDAGVKRFIHMSANGARKYGTSGYHRSKFAGEESVKNSGMDYTIIRPSIIFGPHDAFVNMLADLMIKMPIVPYFGKGDYKLQPVYVDDIAKIFSESITNKDCFNKTFQVGGNKAFEYKELLRIISRAVGRDRILVSVPMPLVKFFTSMLETFPWYPLTTDALVMLEEGNVCEDNEVFKILGFTPTDFETKIKEYIKY